MAISPTHEQSAYFYRKALTKANTIKAAVLLDGAKNDIKFSRTPDAKAKLTEAQALDPGNGEIGALLVTVSGDTAAEERRRKANELYEKGKAQYEREEYQGAVATLEDAVKLNPNHNAAADLLAKARESDRISSTERVDRIARMHEEALKAYGGGDYGKAKELYQGILKLDPNDDKAKKNLQLIESKMGGR